MIRIESDWRDAASWDAYVHAHPEARYCQLYGYGHVVACYGYKPRYLAVLRNRDLVGVLAATEVSSLVYRHRLVSQPFSEYGGVLLHRDLSADETAETIRALRQHLREAARGSTLELHGNHGLDRREMLADQSEPVGHIAVMALDADIETLWKQLVRHSVRKAVKQAEAHRIRVTFGANEAVLKDVFFPLYLKSMKRLGVPPHKLAYYTRSLESFGERMILAIARNPEGTAVAGLLGFSCNARVNIINTVSDPAYWNLRANDLLHWAMIKRTAESGHACFDFGSVRYEGQLTYKKKWGTEFLEHRNYLFGARERMSRQPIINSSSRSMQRMSRIWRSYVPDGVGRRIGPLIRGQLAR